MGSLMDSLTDVLMDVLMVLLLTPTCLDFGTDQILPDSEVPTTHAPRSNFSRKRPRGKGRRYHTESRIHLTPRRALFACINKLNPKSVTSYMECPLPSTLLQSILAISSTLLMVTGCKCGPHTLLTSEISTFLTTLIKQFSQKWKSKTMTYVTNQDGFSIKYIWIVVPLFCLRYFLWNPFYIP